MDIEQQKQKARQYLQRGELAPALDLLTALCGQHPADVDGLALHGIVLTMSGRHEDAVSSFQKALMLQPDAFSIHNNLGNVFKAIGKIAEAEASYRSALRIHHGHIHACTNLGALLAETGRTQEAETLLTKVTRLAPDFVDAWNQIGNLYLTQNDLTAAESCYRKALAIDPSFADSLCNLAELLRADRRTNEAEAIYRKGLAAMPGHADLRGGLASLLERKGDFDEAINLVARRDDQGAYNPRILLARAALSDRISDTEDIIPELESALKVPMTVRERMDLHFEIGRLYDRAGAFKKAFYHYRAGNNLDQSEFDEQATVAEFDRLMDVFKRSNFARWPRSGFDSDLPVFIVGMPRSGTSLVEQIIASHPDAFGAGELDAIDSIAASLPGRLNARDPYPECLDHLASPVMLQAEAENYINSLRNLAPGAVFVTDKMPHNFRHLGLIELLLPGVRIIHCRRDPRDTCLSIYFNQFNYNHPYAHDLGHLGRYYDLYVELMDHWNTVLSTPILTVDYEDLIFNQEATTRLIVDFIGLPWNDDCLQFHRNRRIVNTPSYRQVRNPIHSRSVGRWKHYREYLSPYFDTSDRGSYVDHRMKRASSSNASKNT